MLLHCAKCRKVSRFQRFTSSVPIRFTGFSQQLWKSLQMRVGKEDYFFGRSFSRKTNLSPDQTSSTAQTLTSTIPFAIPISRTTFSVKSVATPDAFFGHEIQSMPAGDNFAA